jgi:F0F1-type ATP synthase assembly protein I
MSQPNKQKKFLDNYVHYSGIGFQMLIIILIGVFGGIKLDQWLNLNFPVFTVILSLLSVAFAIYYAVKDMLKNNNSKEDKKSE